MPDQTPNHFEQAAQNIAGRCSGTVGIGIELLVPLIIPILQDLFKCGTTEEAADPVELRKKIAAAKNAKSRRGQREYKRLKVRAARRFKWQSSEPISNENALVLAEEALNEIVAAGKPVLMGAADQCGTVGAGSVNEDDDMGL